MLRVLQALHVGETSRVRGPTCSRHFSPKQRVLPAGGIQSPGRPFSGSEQVLGAGCRGVVTALTWGTHQALCVWVPPRDYRSVNGVSQSCKFSGDEKPIPRLLPQNSVLPNSCAVFGDGSSKR